MLKKIKKIPSNEIIISLGAGPITNDSGIKRNINFESLIREISKLFRLLDSIDIFKNNFPIMIIFFKVSLKNCPVVCT